MKKVQTRRTVRQEGKAGAEAFGGYVYGETRAEAGVRTRNSGSSGSR